MQVFDGDGCEVVDGFVGPAVVVPVDPFQGGDLDLVEAAPRPAPVDQLGLEQPDRGFGQGVVYASPTLADRPTTMGFGPSGKSRDIAIVPPAGFEPATHGLGNRCSFP
jgi:hypothetical protein